MPQTDEWRSWKRGDILRVIPKDVYDAFRGIERDVAQRAGIHDSGDYQSIGKSVDVLTIIVLFLIENHEAVMAIADDWKASRKLV